MRTSALTPDHVANAIRAEMADQRITQRALADALGTTHRSINRKLGGEQPITVAELLTICAHLNTPPSRLLFDAESRAARRASA